MDTITIDPSDAVPFASAMCGSCDWHGQAKDVVEVTDCRLTPGDPSPVGRCPVCDSLAYLDRPIDRARDAASALVGALQECVEYGALTWDHDPDNEPNCYRAARDALEAAGVES